MVIFAIFLQSYGISCEGSPLNNMTPMHSRYQYAVVRPEFMNDMRLTEVISSGEGGQFITQTITSFPRNDSNRVVNSNSWFGILHIPDSMELSYDHDYLDELADLAPDETVTIPVRTRIEVKGEHRVVDLSYSVSHIGCGLRDVMGSNIVVHAYEVVRQNARVEEQAIQITTSRFVREVAPDLGWWVAHEGAQGSMVLVEVSD